MKLFLTLLGSCTILTSGFAVDFSNLANCTNDIKQNTALPNTYTSQFVPNYQTLLMKLQAPDVRASLPLVYQQNALDPFITFLTQLGAANFQTIFTSQQLSGNYSFLKEMIPDAAEAILQSGVMDAAAATNAFQEVINDLYMGFLSEENRISKQTGMQIKPPDRGVLPGLVKWGNPENGPYTWPADATIGVQMKAAVVSLPPNNRLGGLLAWTALPHETAGHDILHADNGLLTELGTLVYNAIMTNLSNNTFQATYWKGCIDEISSDVLGLLNGGPSIGIGLVGYFRGLRNGLLANVGYMPPSDAHPIDILRGYVAVRVISKMPFAGASAWAQAIKQEVDKDLQAQQQALYVIDPANQNQRYMLNTMISQRAAEIVADTIMNSKLNSLEGHSLSEIQTWTDQDETAATALGMLMASRAPLPATYRNDGYYAAHVVAGATMEGLKAGANIPALFTSMIDYLNTMNQYDSNWGGTTPPPTPVPPPMPVPPSPTPPQGYCACLYQCLQNCQAQAAPVVSSPRYGTHSQDESKEEVAVNE